MHMVVVVAGGNDFSNWNDHAEILEGESPKASRDDGCVLCGQMHFLALVTEAAHDRHDGDVALALAGKAGVVGKANVHLACGGGNFDKRIPLPDVMKKAAKQIAWDRATRRDDGCLLIRMLTSKGANSVTAKAVATTSTCSWIGRNDANQLSFID